MNGKEGVSLFVGYFVINFDFRFLFVGWLGFKKKFCYIIFCLVGKLIRGCFFVICLYCFKGQKYGKQNLFDNMVY